MNTRLINTGKLLLLLVWSAVISSCSTTRNAARKDDGKIEVVFVQVNDVYEIAPIEGGRIGGMARVATLKKMYKAQNPNTLLLMAGDFLSPSLYNSLQYRGKRVRGKQMVEAMNTAGVDIAIFGNHEFDINESELEERLNESSFQWIASNAFHKTAAGTVPFEQSAAEGRKQVPTRLILTLRDADGTVARIGFLGITIASVRSPYASFEDPLASAKKIYNEIKDSCDAVIAITHQGVAADLKLAEELPGLAAIIGGHEHNMQFHKRGNVYITKAHANARSAFIIKFSLDKNLESQQVDPVLKHINDSIPFDAATEVVVKKWVQLADSNLATLGFNPANILMSNGEPLDGRETETRGGRTNLTEVIVQAMADASPEADVAIFNAGSIRLDDVLQMPVTEYDILRTLPFGGGIREVDMNGNLLKRVLTAGMRNRNSGGFLHYTPAKYDSASASWTLKNEVIADENIYRVAVTDYLIAGLEENLGFLNVDNPEIVKTYPADTTPGSPKSDIRLAVIRYLKKRSQ
jgi:2',3'-cyclic-nucleotide 2'-phosphodiesterase (5'-nucleotidase family)